VSAEPTPLPRLDHVVIVVGALADAGADFAAAGFTVTPGGRHDALPTENALVCFADGSYLELLAACDPETREGLRERRAGPGWERHLRGASAVARRFLPSLAGPDGVSDWVLLADRLTPVAARLRSHGMSAAGPVRMGRERRDGERLEWELLLPDAALLPFWISDRTPRDRRVPSAPEATTHANGARGIAAVRVRAPVVPAAALELGDALGLVPRAEAGLTVLDLKAVRVEVVEGEPAAVCGVRIAAPAGLPTGLQRLGVEAEAPGAG